MVGARGNTIASTSDIYHASRAAHIRNGHALDSELHLPSISFFEHPGGDWVHKVVAHDVVLLGDPRIGVPEKARSEIEPSGLVDRRRARPAEAVRGDAFEPCLIHDGAKLPAHVVRGQRVSVPVAEQQCVRVDR